MSRFLALFLLRRTFGELRRLESDIYYAPRFNGIGLTLGPIILLSSKIIIECSQPQICAVIAHERAHIILHSGLFRRFFSSNSDIRRQETEADAYVKSLGLGHDFAAVLAQYSSHFGPSLTHPSLQSRITFLCAK